MADTITLIFSSVCRIFLAYLACFTPNRLSFSVSSGGSGSGPGIAGSSLFTSSLPPTSTGSALIEHNHSTASGRVLVFKRLKGRSALTIDWAPGTITFMKSNEKQQSDNADRKLDPNVCVHVVRTVSSPKQTLTAEKHPTRAKCSHSFPLRQVSPPEQSLPTRPKTSHWGKSPHLTTDAPLEKVSLLEQYLPTGASLLTRTNSRHWNTTILDLRQQLEIRAGQKS